MTRTPPDVAPSQINALIECCLQCQRSLLAASMAVSDPSVSMELASFSRQQERFTEELAMRLSASGDAHFPQNDLPRAEGSLPNFDGAARLGILLTCERTSNSMVAAFRRTLGEDVSPEIGGIIEAHYEAIQEAHERIKVLRSSAATDELH